MIKKSSAMAPACVLAVSCSGGETHRTVTVSASPATMKQVTDAHLATAPRTFTRNRLEIAIPQPTLAREFGQLVLSPTGSDVLTRAGFEHP